MKILDTPYRSFPEDARCYFRKGEACFSHTLHQKNLYLRHFSPANRELLSLLLICRTRALSGDWHRRLRPDFLSVTYIHTGETMVRIGENSFVAEPGDLVLMPPGSDYEFGSPKGGERSAIVLQGELIGSISRHFGENCVFTDDGEHHLEKSMEQFFGGRKEEELALLSFELLSTLPCSEEHPPLPRIIETVTEKIRRDMEHPLPLSRLAAEAGVTERTLTRIFQKHLKLSPHQYLMAQRMEKARQMLVLEEFSIKEIAISAGYRNALNFSTEFRKFFGCSPTGYRMQQAGLPPEKHPVGKNSPV